MPRHLALVLSSSRDRVGPPVGPDGPVPARAGRASDAELADAMRRHPAGKRAALTAVQRAAAMRRHPAGRRASILAE